MLSALQPFLCKSQLLPRLAWIAHEPAQPAQPMCCPRLQQELVEPGLVGVLYAVEARGRGDSVLSAWQVKDSGGRWCSVALAADEVAVTLGHLMQHACAGLVQPGCHRVVGDPYSSGSLGADSRAGSTVGSRTRQGALPSQPKHGRRQLHFGLRPRPAAVLDLRRELEAAGHTVSARHAAALLNAASRPAILEPRPPLCPAARPPILCACTFLQLPPHVSGPLAGGVRVAAVTCAPGRLHA
jgi:hypothetical protein